MKMLKFLFIVWVKSLSGLPVTSIAVIIRDMVRFPQESQESSKNGIENHSGGGLY